MTLEPIKSDMLENSEVKIIASSAFNFRIELVIKLGKNDLKDIFNIARVEKSTKLFEVPWYFSIDNWEDYCYYISSGERSEVKRPSKRILHYHEFNPLGEDQDDDE